MSKLYLQHDYQVTGRDYVETDGGDTPGGAHNYSTDEQVIGTWTDGKPLYEKTIEFPITQSNGYTNYTHGISDIVPISCEGYAASSDGTNIYSAGANTISSLGFAFNTEYVNAYQSGSYFVGYNARVVIRYTKTTD